jgi:hypothetical protein
MNRLSVAACLARRVCNGLFVHYIPSGSADLVFSSLPLEESSVSVWHEELALWCRKGNLYPPIVSLGGYCFSLGTNYDEACCGTGVCSIFDLPPSGNAQDVVRDKVALAIDCPEPLINLLYEMGSYVAIVGDGSEKLSASLNWEACITLTGSYDRESLVDHLSREVGGADYVVMRASRPFVMDLEVGEMLSLTHGVCFALVDEMLQTIPSVVRQIPFGEPKRMMQEICMYYRR